MATAEVSRARRKEKKDKRGAVEKLECKRGRGRITWVTGGARIVNAFRAHAIQREQADPTVEDLLECNKVIKDIKVSASTALRIRWMPEDFVVGVWTDSSLMNVDGEVLEDEEAKKELEAGHNLRSLSGALVARYSAKKAAGDGEVPIYSSWIGGPKPPSASSSRRPRLRR